MFKAKHCSARIKMRKTTPSYIGLKKAHNALRAKKLLCVALTIPGDRQKFATLASAAENLSGKISTKSAHITFVCTNYAQN